MERIPINSAPATTRAVEVLRRGGVIVLPTDTLYGFSAAMSRHEAFDRIARIKGRAAGRSFICLADSIDMVEHFVDDWGATSREEMQTVWPAPLTAVFRAGATCPEWFGETIAFRVPDIDGLRRIITSLGEPILSTSVNRSGRDPLDDLDRIASEFGGEVDLLIERETAATSVASTVVDFTAKPAAVLRPGTYDWPGAGKPSN